MRWQDKRRSSNIEDRRGVRRTGKAAGGGIGILIVALVAMYFGIDPRLILDMGSQMSTEQSGTAVSVPQSAENRELADFVSVVLADTEETWGSMFSQSGKTYREPTLVLFSGSVQSACGFAQAAMGPFYCPADQKVYIDLSFYKDLRDKLNSPGDFAQAYVIAHEVGHHVQNLLGISAAVQKQRAALSQTEYNKLSVRLELQADCLAGVWAYHADRMRQMIEDGDIEEGLQAASSIGDDRLQQQSKGYVTPDSFTHGTSAQRVEWFSRGYKQGQTSACDTFAANSL